MSYFFFISQSIFEVSNHGVLLGFSLSENFALVFFILKSRRCLGKSLLELFSLLTQLKIAKQPFASEIDVDQMVKASYLLSANILM